MKWNHDWNVELKRDIIATTKALIGLSLAFCTSRMEKYSKQHQETSFPQITSTRRSHCYRIAATFVLVGLCLYISSLSRVDDAHGHTVPESASDMEFDWLQVNLNVIDGLTRCLIHWSDPAIGGYSMDKVSWPSPMCSIGATVGLR